MTKVVVALIARPDKTIPQMNGELEVRKTNSFTFYNPNDIWNRE
ncbi:hypothetical protein [Bacillus sp. JJ1773]